MTSETVVWHGVTRKMKFDSFATYFECPTSTSTSRFIARGFSGPDGMILKLKSKFKESCSVMLDVSVFSNYPEECERLFVKETLIITDVMMRVGDEWTAFGSYFEALVYFEVRYVLEWCPPLFILNPPLLILCAQKISSGNAANDSWNISESKKVQGKLALIIGDYIATQPTNGAEFTSDIPNYIRTLFNHYCSTTLKPQFNGINVIQETMIIELQEYIFERGDSLKKNVIGNELDDDDTQLASDSHDRPKISDEKVKVIFAKAVMYVNDQGNEITINR